MATATKAAESSAKAKQAEMDKYVSRYQSRLTAAQSVFEAKDRALSRIDGKDVADRSMVQAARLERDAAKADYDQALQDYKDAQDYAAREVAKAEAEEEAAEKSNHGVLKKAATVAGVVGLGVGGAAIAGVGALGKAANKSRLLMNNTGSVLAMSFAKYILGYDGRGLPPDPTRKNWDPAMKDHNCHRPECQPSLI